MFIKDGMDHWKSALQKFVDRCNRLSVNYWMEAYDLDDNCVVSESMMKTQKLKVKEKAVINRIIVKYVCNGCEVRCRGFHESKLWRMKVSPTDTIDLNRSYFKVSF